MSATTGLVVWITGLPASGKSTLATRATNELRAAGKCCCLLDSDAIRKSVFPHLGYGVDDRDVFYEALAQIAALLARQGLCVLVAATAHRLHWRERARSLAPHYIEVHVATPPEICAERDDKGLYRAARTGNASALPGVDVSFEPSPVPDIVALGGHDSAALAALCSRITEQRANQRQKP